MRPAHAPQPALRLGPTGQKIVGGPTSGGDRQGMRGAADPESGNARLIEVLMVNARRRFALFTGIAIRDPLKRRI
jgi:hypothetical protein